jgi:hypothetical protein
MSESSLCTGLCELADCPGNIAWELVLVLVDSGVPRDGTSIGSMSKLLEKFASWNIRSDEVRMLSAEALVVPNMPEGPAPLRLRIKSSDNCDDDRCVPIGL